MRLSDCLPLDLRCHGLNRHLDKTSTCSPAAWWSWPRCRTASEVFILILGPSQQPPMRVRLVFRDVQGFATFCFSWSGLHVGLLGVAYRKHVIDRDIEVWNKIMDNINKKRFCPSLTWTFKQKGGMIQMALHWPGSNCSYKPKDLFRTDRPNCSKVFVCYTIVGAIFH